MIITVTIISFILEFILNKTLYNSFLSPLIIFTTLIILEPYFKKHKNRYLIYTFTIGLIYDIVYTGTYLMNASMFLIIGIFVRLINKNTPNNFLITIIELIILICTYRFLCFIFLSIIGFIKFNLSIYFESVYTSIILNLIYGILLYFILYFISKKFNIKRIN